MALKGHTKIELTNVETGEVEVHEDDNMVTNALSKLLGSYGVFCNNALRSVIARSGSRSDTVKILTGGLMLFDSIIEENPNTIYPTGGTNLVGCGSQIAYSGTNTTAGSYNETESGWTEDGSYKHVWDFTTHQANGTISCASLTTCSGGKITIGTPAYSSDYAYNSEALFVNDKNANGMSFHFNSSISPYWILYADAIYNHIIVPSTIEEVSPYRGVTSENENFKKSIFYKKSVDLSFYRMGFSNFSIFDTSYDLELIKKITVEMPQGLKDIFTQEKLNNTSNIWRVSAFSDENNIYFLLRVTTHPYDYIENMETFYVWEINVETLESNYYSITNTLNDWISFDNSIHSSNNITSDIAIINGLLICTGGGTKTTYIINMSNPSDISNIGYLGNGLFSYGDKVFANDGGFVKVLDTISKEILYKNIEYGIFTGSDYKIINPVRGTHYFMAHSFSGTNYMGATIFTDPAMLVTINNLETPVQKTSAQTMKVTYVLTQE